MSPKLQRISELAKQDHTQQFTSLAHLLTVEMLGEAYRRLRKDASPGVDGLTAQEYEQDLVRNLQDLHRRLREGRYRAQPVRRVYIEQEGKQRPLGIPALEDKIVQKAVVSILDAIYEQDFLPCSYGYRPGRGPQDALDEVFRAIVGGKVNYVLEVDVRNYFQNIVHEHLMTFLQQRIKDSSLMRLIAKWLHAGVLEEGRLLPTTKGTSQGAVISPVLANVYLHHVLDQWLETEVKPRLRGEAHLHRYADDFMFGFQHQEDAERVAGVLRERFAQYGLELNEEKTRLIAFGRFAERDLQRQGKGKPSTFDFLGFTHICARNRAGKFTVHVRTARKRMRRAMRRVAEWCRTHRHLPVSEQHRILSRALQGHYAYYGRRSNMPSLRRFLEFTKRTWYKWLRRRSQRRRLSWDAYNHVLRRCPLPGPHVMQRVTARP
ncbi:MAG TPA: group II intron reverse transcriptase/maturase [bacterium]|nr:group II intron reverse transcriptase/maturase [bacterium]